MKKVFHYFVLALSIGALSMSCSKDDESDNPNNNGSNGNGENDPIETFLNLNVTGDESAEFSSNAITSLSGSPNNGYDFIITRGGAASVDELEFNFSLISRYINVPPQPIPTGTFNLIAEEDLEDGDGNYAAMFTNYNTGTSFGHEVSGTLEITESTDEYIEGTFTLTTTSHTNGDEEVDIEGSFLAPRN